jgi:glycosyltransferase involved in cell wall biosynthesis
MIIIIDHLGRGKGLDWFSKRLTEEVSTYSRVLLLTDYNSSGVIRIWRGTRGLLRLPGEMYSLVKLICILAWHRPDKVIINYFSPGYLIYTIKSISAMFTRGLVVVVHDAKPIYKSHGVVPIDYILRGTQLVTLSDSAFKHLESVGYMSTKINHGDYLGYLSLNKDRPKDIDILFFGVYKKVKGLDLFIESLGQLKGICNVMIQSKMNSSDAKVVREALEHERFHGRVDLNSEFLGYQEMNVLFSRVRYIVLPYTHVWNSGVVLLAMSAGIPVLCSNIPEFLVLGLNKRQYFASGDSSSLAAAIDFLVGLDDSEKQELIKTQFKILKNNYSWEYQVKKLNDSGLLLS